MVCDMLGLERSNKILSTLHLVTRLNDIDFGVHDDKYLIEKWFLYHRDIGYDDGISDEFCICSVVDKILFYSCQRFLPPCPWSRSIPKLFLGSQPNIYFFVLIIL